MRTIEVTAAVCERGGRILAARRARGHLAGLWEFPGGKLEPGEGAAVCLRRELDEEFGVRAQIGPYIGENVHQYDAVRIRLMAYWVPVVEGDFILADHDAIEWVSWDELAAVEWAPADIPLVAAAHAYRAEQLSLAYYCDNARAYAESTSGIDMSAHRGRFLRHVVPGGHLLDYGCGAGRDAAAFESEGFRVSATDACPELAKIASGRISGNVQVAGFDESLPPSTFDGIWACASLLHCSPFRLPRVIGRLVAALKPGGALYMSFKSGDGLRSADDGRSFADFSEESLRTLVAQVGGLRIADLWRNEAVSAEWLSCVMKVAPRGE